MQGFVGKEKDLEKDTALNREPVKVKKNRRYVIKSATPDDHSCSCILYSLKASDGRFRYSTKKTVPIIQSGTYESMNK